MNLQRAHVAQWIRHRPPKPRIVGSNPTVGKLYFTRNFLFTFVNYNGVLLKMSAIVNIFRK